jgi:hypothetical protein
VVALAFSGGLKLAVMALTTSPAIPVPEHADAGKLKKISLIPVVAVLYAYCAGGPFDYEAMVSTSGPGMALLFILIVPWLFSVPMALASAEMATAMPVEGLLSLDARGIWRFLGFSMRVVELDGHIFHVGLLWRGPCGLCGAGQSCA